MTAKRPNFVIIMCEHFSALADPIFVDFPVKMPNLKALANNSVLFENAYCNSPVCSPSRLSFISGLYPCNNGVYDNGSTMPSNFPTYGHVMTRGGYQTAMCGRMHIQGLDIHRGFEQRLASEIGNPLPENPADCPKEFAPYPELTPEKTKEYAPEFSDCSIFEHDDYISSQAVEYLETRKDSEDTRPFCLTVGYLAAHPSMKPLPKLKEFYDEYIKMDLPITTITHKEYENLPEHIKRITHSEEIFSKEYQQHEMATYFARLSYLDMEIGKVLDTLKKNKLDEETIVIFTSDHGDGLGRHGQWAKMYFYEEAQRVPFYIQIPGQAPGRIKDRMSLVDVMPTIAELGGCDLSIPTDGKSIVSLLKGKKRTEEEQIIFSEYHGYRSVSDIYMIIKGDYKYCHYLLEPGELYNLKTDPSENNNLIDDPAYESIRADLELEIRKVVDIEALEKKIKEYNLQRQTIAEAFAASPIIGLDNVARIEQYRKKRNEPWWDGGAYCAQWEGHLRGKAINEAERHEAERLAKESK